MNMEDCPVHHAEVNPPYPFVCSCKETDTDWERMKVSWNEYHGWAAWGSYHAWVQENQDGQTKYAWMLRRYQESSIALYRKWLLRDITKTITATEEFREEYMTSNEIKDLLERLATEEYYEGMEGREED